MVFIRPKILDTAEQASFETNKKYNYIRNLQIEENDDKNQSKSKVKEFIGSSPILPEIETYQEKPQ